MSRQEQPDNLWKKGQDGRNSHCPLAAWVNASQVSGSPQQTQEDSEVSMIITVKDKNVILEDKMKRLHVTEELTDKKASHQTAAGVVYYSSQTEQDIHKRKRMKYPLQKYGSGSPYFHDSEPVFTGHASFTRRPQQGSNNRGPADTSALSELHDAQD